VSAPRGAASGLAAAALFGASTPVAKLLVPGTGPLILAGLLYLGAGLGLLAAAPFRRRGAEAPIQRSDLPALASVILAGGVVGPLLLVVGLARLSGAAAALLLNLEAPFTIALAVAMLGEHLPRREVLGAAAVVLGAAALTWAPSAVGVDIRSGLRASPVRAPRGRSTTTSVSGFRSGIPSRSSARRRWRRARSTWRSGSSSVSGFPPERTSAERCSQGRSATG